MSDKHCHIETVFYSVLGMHIVHNTNFCETYIKYEEKFVFFLLSKDENDVQQSFRINKIKRNQKKI